MKIALALAVLLASGLALGETTDITRGNFTVTFNACPKCPMRLRLTNDGKRAFVNTARVPESERPAMAERAFALMAKAADTKKGGALRPLMGWSSWNTFGVAISEDIILSVAEALATNGLKAAGYTYVNIDDGFYSGHDPATGRLRWNLKRFPRGLKPVADGIRARGLHPGIYSDAGADTCGSIWSHDPDGRGAGLYGHDADDCRLYFNDLGFEFIKVDYCGALAQHLDERARYTEIAKALRATGKTIRYNVCRWAFPGTWVSDIAESWRTTGDIRANWSSVRGIVRKNLYLGAYVKPGHFNDLDMLQVGRYVGEIRNAYARDDTGLTPLEEATHFGLWCMLSSPLLIGCDVRTLPETTRELVTNPYLLTMSQNDLGLAGEVVAHPGEDAYVLAKDADTRFGTARFLVLYNAGGKPHDFTVEFAALELGGKVAVLDLGERADLGVFSDVFAATVPAHGALFYRLDAEKRLDRTVYEAEAAYLSDYQELRDAAKAGTAHPAAKPAASGGMVVRHLGARATNDLVWKEVRVSQRGTYTLTFMCANGAEKGRGFDVQVDGGAKTRLVDDGKPVTLTVALAAGVHTVRVSNDTAWCPDLDALRVTRR